MLDIEVYSLKLEENHCFFSDERPYFPKRHLRSHR